MSQGTVCFSFLFLMAAELSGEALFFFRGPLMGGTKS
jgi:hypothetical protein